VLDPSLGVSALRVFCFLCGGEDEMRGRGGY
jgi:hypothetical protein